MNLLFYRFCQSLLYIIFKVWNRFLLIGEESLPDESSGYIIAANHVSYLDPPVLGGRLRKPIVFLANQKLFKIPWLKALISPLGALPIAAGSDFKSLRRVIRALKGGSAVVMFPEGTRSNPGELLKPEPGVAFLAHAANVPIVPCYIAGTNKAWPKGQKYIKPARIRVFIGEPFHVGDAPDQERSQFYENSANQVMYRIKELKTKSETDGVRLKH